MFNSHTGAENGNNVEGHEQVIEQEYQHLASMLCQLACFKNLTLSNITTIKSGLSQPSFHVEYEDKYYFAKYIPANSIEPLVGQIAADLALAPSVVFFNESWLITQFLSNNSLDELTLPETEKITITLALLTRLHSIELNGLGMPSAIQNDKSGKLLEQCAVKRSGIPKLDITLVINDLLNQIECTEDLAYSLQQLSKQLLSNLETSLKLLPELASVICHGDANFSNVLHVNIDSKNPLKSYQLIDFECAQLAPFTYDIAMLMAVNDIELTQADFILTEYKRLISSLNKAKYPSIIVDNLGGNGCHNHKNETALVTRYYDLSILINVLWYFREYQYKGQLNYRELAQKQLMLLKTRYEQVSVILNQMR